MTAEDDDDNGDSDGGMAWKYYFDDGRFYVCPPVFAWQASKVVIVILITGKIGGMYGIISCYSKGNRIFFFCRIYIFLEVLQEKGL